MYCMVLVELEHRPTLGLVFSLDAHCFVTTTVGSKGSIPGLQGPRLSNESVPGKIYYSHTFHQKQTDMSVYRGPVSPCKLINL